VFRREELPEPTRDRRVERTRAALRDALIDLMQESGWDAIDVQTLCRRANVGRSTFYQHFPNKEELLKSSLAGLGQTLRAHAAPGPLGFVSGLVTHVHEMQALFRALLVRRSAHYVQDRFRELLMEMMLADQPGSRRSWQATARAHALAGALFELLVWWLGSNRPHKPREIEALFRQWSTAVLDAPMLLK
jgi:AcrR family transcriptional regulator